MKILMMLAGFSVVMIIEAFCGMPWYILLLLAVVKAFMGR